MPLLRPLILVMFAVTAAPVPAQQTTEIYKCVDPSGRPSYTNDKRETAGRKCELVTTQVNIAPPPPAKTTRSASPSSFPRESANERATAKGRQREILESELSTEQQLLTKARQTLAEQEAVRTGEERNYAKVEERLRPFKDNVETHEKNVEALRRELGNLNR
jgi:hypothetical protein